MARQKPPPLPPEARHLLLTWPLRHNAGKVTVRDEHRDKNAGVNVVNVREKDRGKDRGIRCTFAPPDWSDAAARNEKRYGDGHLEDREHMLQETLEALRRDGVNVGNVLSSLERARRVECLEPPLNSLNATARRNRVERARKGRRRVSACAFRSS